MAVPSIKGTAYSSVHDDLHRMLDEERLAYEELEAELSKDELELFDSKVLATRWYPIDTYRKLLAVVARVEARSRIDEYLFERGWRAAERLKEAGIYRQLGADEHSSKSWGARVAALVGGISGLLYNFTRWSVEETTNPAAFQIVVDDAKDFADECRWTAQGFVA
ncbi:MAG TPA: hypothetical protein VLU96_11070, partial [Gaiellaceae bacterium]|nr:hypothetical protein [Gaiellaceae bacterium]